MKLTLSDDNQKRADFCFGLTSQLSNIGTCRDIIKAVKDIKTYVLS